MADAFVPRLAAAARRVLVRFGLTRRLLWRKRAGSELDFWQAWLTQAPGTEQWARDRELRLDPQTEIRDALVRAELERNPRDEVAILDVGAGPITSLGYRYGEKTVRIVATDPLAHGYDRLLREAQIEPPVRTIAIAGEDLLDHLVPGEFDIAYSCNALDHSADPVRIVSNMIALVRPGGVVLLRHKRNEGASARYGGLHQWNFDVAGDDLLVWNEAVATKLGAALAARATTTAWIDAGEVVARLVVHGG